MPHLSHVQAWGQTKEPFCRKVWQKGNFQFRHVCRKSVFRQKEPPLAEIYPFLQSFYFKMSRWWSICEILIVYSSQWDIWPTEKLFLPKDSLCIRFRPDSEICYIFSWTLTSQTHTYLEKETVEESRGQGGAIGAQKVKPHRIHGRLSLLLHGLHG